MIARLLVAFTALFGLASLASAATIWADARVYNLSPSYYSQTVGDFAVSYREELPFGSKVELHLGLGGMVSDFAGGIGDRRVEWREIKTLEAEAVAPYEWTASFSEVLHERSQNWVYDRLEFVFVVTLPNGKRYYEKGSQTARGFYEASLPLPSEVSDQSTARYQRLQVRAVARN